MGHPVSYYLNDMQRIQRRKENGEQLYAKDTDRFEPIPENREHFLNTMLPMIYDLAYKIHGRYSSRIELTDVIQSGMIGALVGIDRYIERAKTREHTVKLSSYTYPYIKKYMNEFCWETNSLLSSERTKQYDSWQSHVKSGDDVNHGEDTRTVFEALGASKSHTQKHTDTNEVKALSDKLFDCLSQKEKNVLFLKYGVGCPAPIDVRSVAKKLSISVGMVKHHEYRALDKLKKAVTANPALKSLLTILSDADESASVTKDLQSWQLAVN